MSVVVRLFKDGAFPQALDLVRAVVTANPGPLKTKEIYRLAMEHPVEGTVDHVLRPDLLERHAGPLPPNLKHPIRSLSYLKTVVLPELVKERWIEKVHTMREMTAEERAARREGLPKSARKLAEEGMAHDWVWQRRIVNVPNPPRPKAVFGTEVGVGEDFSHLNRRRRRAREASIQRDVEWVRELEQVRGRAARAEKALLKAQASGSA